MSKKIRELTGLFFIGWGFAVWIGFLLVNVGPCNNRAIPLWKSAPIVVSMLAYWILGVLRFFQKDSVWLHYVIWGSTAFVAILELPLWTPSQVDWYLCFLIVALLLVACAPSVAFRLCQLPLIQSSPRKSKMIIWSATIASVAIVSWIFGPLFWLILEK